MEFTAKDFRKMFLSLKKDKQKNALILKGWNDFSNKIKREQKYDKTN